MSIDVSPYFTSRQGQFPTSARTPSATVLDRRQHVIGTFATGELTDGILQGAAPAVGAIPSPALGVRGGGNAPAADITFDLGGVFQIEDVVIGTHVTAGLNNNAPDDFTISYSNAVGGPFVTPEFVDLETAFGPLTDGHHDLAVDIADAMGQFVRFSFDGGSMSEPGGSDPNEKWMLDEITINGSAVQAVPEPASIAIWSLIGLGLAGFGYYRIRRKQ